jgi:hypothetical protein
MRLSDRPVDSSSSLLAALPRLIRGCSPRVPSWRQVGKLLHARIKLNYLAQAYNLCILLLGVAPTQKLPNAVFGIVRDMQDGLTIADYLSKGNDSNVPGLCEPPILLQNNLPFRNQESGIRRQEECVRNQESGVGHST